MLPRFIILLTICLKACAPHFIPNPDPNLTALPTPSAIENHIIYTPIPVFTPNMPPIQSTPISPKLQNPIEKAKEYLAQRLSISTSQITVVDARDVVWSNSSLGCPQPGMMYAEVLTPGFLILLNANGQEYEYHAGKNLEFFLCENPVPPVPDMSVDT